MVSQRQIDDAVSAAIVATAPRRLVTFSGDTLLERVGYTDESVGDLEQFLENELQFGFRDDLTLRPDMTVGQARSVVRRCLLLDGDFAL